MAPPVPKVFMIRPSPPLEPQSPHRVAAGRSRSQTSWPRRILGRVRVALWRLAGRAEPMRAQNGRGDGPPDLDELWRDFNRKLGNLFGGRGSRGSNGSGEPGGGPSLPP